MHVDANGIRLWFDVEGPVLVPDGATMRERPTIILLHGGPGSFDHSYLKPDFGRLAKVAQVIYLDLRDHGRSERGDPHAWRFETCADDILAFCHDKLARFKTPRSIDFIVEMPRDPNGKLYKRKLRDPYWEGRERAI